MAGSSSHLGVRTLFGLLGLAAGVYGGWQAYDRTNSIVLAVFVGLLLTNYVGRGIADVITDPEKGRRFVFFTLPVVVSVGGLAGAYALWGIWWVAVIVGSVVYIVGSVVATAMFPSIAIEEAVDTASRMGELHEPSSVEHGTVPPVPAPPPNGAPSPYERRSPYDNMKRP